MKKVLASILLGLSLLAIVPAQAYTQKDEIITLTKDEVKACKDGGGCIVVSMMKLQNGVSQLMDQAYQMGVADSEKKLQEAYNAGVAEGIRQASAGKT